MERSTLKKKLRKLKREEIRIRYAHRNYDSQSPLIWDQFFSTKDSLDETVKFNMNILILMEHGARKEIYGAFFYAVYYQYYQENGLSLKEMYNPSLLAMFGLGIDATMDEIKDKFRYLAKLYHPDNGGDSKDFIQLREAYDQLKTK